MDQFRYCVIVLFIFICSTNSMRWDWENKYESLNYDMKNKINNFSCPCENKILCKSIGDVKNHSSPHILKFMEKQNKSEVFVFMLKCDSSVWGKFDWDKITTIALAGFYDPHLVCHAHKHGARVVKLGNIPKEQLSNPNARKSWIMLQVMDVSIKFMDGINIDFEDAIENNSPEQTGLTLLVKETTNAFHYFIPSSEVSFDVAWNANGVDGRYYDYYSIGQFSDRLFVMSYDEQSQIWTGDCTARPNSGIYKTAAGLNTYFKLGIPVKKLILGVPWYGYNYPCISIDSNGTCYLKKIPFRGCNCSDAAGKEYSFDYIIKNKEERKATYKWDKNTLTPYYTFKDPNTNIHYQMRYDDQHSLPYKYMLSVFNGMAGVGMWTANFLDYSDTEEGKVQRDSMWGLLP